MSNYFPDKDKSYQNMTMREYYASQALIGMLTGYDCSPDRILNTKAIADDAFEMAEAMVARSNGSYV